MEQNLRSWRVLGAKITKLEVFGCNFDEVGGFLWQHNLHNSNNSYNSFSEFNDFVALAKEFEVFIWRAKRAFIASAASFYFFGFT